MRRFLILLLLLVVPVAADDIAGAKGAAKSFLALVDAGKYTQAYKSSAAIVRSSVTEKQFADQVGDIRSKLGAVKSRKLSKTTPTESGGQKFVVLEYTTDFANQKGVTELVSPMLENGKWHVAGYRFK